MISERPTIGYIYIYILINCPYKQSLSIHSQGKMYCYFSGQNLFGPKSEDFAYKCSDKICCRMSCHAKYKKKI